MKLFRSGFTLAEVLVTIGILGVVAAMTVPTVMMDGKYKQYVAKIAKFNSSLESAASEYAVTHDDFSSREEVRDFVRDHLIFKNGTEKNKIKFVESGPQYGGSMNAELKDGTIIASVYVTTGNDNVLYGATDTDVTGNPFFSINFKPNVPGMDNFVDTVTFEVSDKGYVFPYGSSLDTNSNRCLKALYDNRWKYNPSFFRSGGACRV